MRKNKNSDENFTSLLSAMDRQAVPPDQEFLKQLRERSAREFASGAPDVFVNTPKSIHIAALRSIIMKSPITKLATAAVVIIACLIGLSVWRGTESGIALADVLARIEQVKAVRYKWTNEIAHHIDPDKPYHVEIRATSLNSGEYGTKSNQEWLDPNGGESTFAEEYFLPQKKMTIGIVPKQKKYTRKEFDDGWVERMQKANPDIKDPLAFLKGILKYKYESLGRSTMDGIEVEGFRTTDPNHWGGKNPQVDIKIWVDVKTRLPVRYDSLASEEVNQRGDKMRTHFVMHDFQWDVPVAAADFEPIIPEDYTGTVIKYPAHITEETAIQGLKVWVELLGKYPDPEIITPFQVTVLRSALETSETPAALRLKEEIKGLTEDEIGNKLADFLMPIRGLDKFYRCLQFDKKDPAYYGKTVTPKDADKVLMRWKVSDNEYRVIFGDLHAETVTPEKLAELEAPLPK
jgi:hypothetical protein